MRARLGQHFLTNANAIESIVSSLKLSDHTAVIEIGPGSGAITEPIVHCLEKQFGKGAQYVGIERDEILAKKLSEKFHNVGTNISFITGDARKELQKILIDIAKTHASFVLVGNIPYYITGFFVRLLGSLEPRPNTIVLTIQREVAERITAKQPHMNMLSASVEYWADAKILFHIPKTSFKPQPKIDSSVIELVPRKKIDQKSENYYKTIKIIFSHPRKTTLNNIKEVAGGEWGAIENAIQALGITNKTRSQELSVEIIKKISKIVYN